MIEKKFRSKEIVLTVHNNEEMFVHGIIMTVVIVMTSKISEDVIKKRILQIFLSLKLIEKIKISINLQTTQTDKEEYI